MHPAADKHTAPSADADTSRWQLPDLLDFDYYVDRDEERLRTDPGERKRLTDRDRRLYRERIAPHIGAAEHTPQHRSAALRRWLGIRRGGDDPTMQALLPGSAFARGQRLVTMGLGVLGFVTGIGVAAALLHYDGEHPVNVSWYLFVLVLLQILLIAGTAAAWQARRSRAVQSAVQDLSLIGHVLKPLLTRASGWVQRQRLAHMPPEVREQAKSRAGLIGGHFALYGPAAVLPMLIPPQMFGICFNLGAILATVTLEWFTDLAFGWGTALNISASTVHGIAHVIALPWSWLFGEGVGVPTLEQVEGTRISLKDPLLLLDAEELRSWRWFLLLAVITYGLLPRLVLLLLSVRSVQQTLNSLPFTHQRTQALYARMITPQLQTEGESGHGPEMPIPEPLTPVTAPRAAPRSEAPPVAEVPATPAQTLGGSAAARRAEPAAKSSTESKAAIKPAASAKQKPRSKTTPERSRPAAEAAKPARSPSSAEASREASPKPSAKPPTPSATSPDAAALKAEHEVEPKAKPHPSPRPAPQPTARPAPEAAKPAARAPAAGIAADACLLLMHVDVADMLETPDHERLQRLLHGLCGWRVAGSATFGGGSAMAKQALALVEQAQWQAPPARVALIADGSQPPITETLRFLRNLRAAAGEHAQVLLTLVGDPDGDDPLPPLAEFEFQDWQRKIEQLRDPYLRLEMLAGPAEAPAAEETH